MVGGRLSKKVILAFAAMVIVVLALAFANDFPEPSPAVPTTSSPSIGGDESPTPSAESSPLPNVEIPTNSPVPSVENVPAPKFETTYTVTSTSMEPTIKKGATVVYMHVPFQSLEVDDIIIFKHPNHPEDLIVARIVGISSNGLLTKGDHNLVANPWDVSAPLLIGKVMQISNP
jgi:signal peptidase I